eukprot:86821_1
MSVVQIDKQLKEYYQSLQVPYDQLFAIYCADNDVDDESLATELEEDADDSILVDFDPNFPLAKPPKNDFDRNQKIFNFIRKCYTNKCLSFAVSMHEKLFKRKTAMDDDYIILSKHTNSSQRNMYSNNKVSMETILTVRDYNYYGMIAMLQELNAEKYDTDSLLDDILETEQSNTLHFCMETLNDKNMFYHIKRAVLVALGIINKNVPERCLRHPAIPITFDKIMLDAFQDGISALTVCGKYIYLSRKSGKLLMFMYEHQQLQIVETMNCEEAKDIGQIAACYDSDLLILLLNNGTCRFMSAKDLTLLSDSEDLIPKNAEIAQCSFIVSQFTQPLYRFAICSKNNIYIFEYRQQQSKYKFIKRISNWFKTLSAEFYRGALCYSTRNGVFIHNIHTGEEIRVNIALNWKTPKVFKISYELNDNNDETKDEDSDHDYLLLQTSSDSGTFASKTNKHLTVNKTVNWSDMPCSVVGCSKYMVSYLENKTLEIVSLGNNECIQTIQMRYNNNDTLELFNTQSNHIIFHDNSHIFALIPKSTIVLQIEKELSLKTRQNATEIELASFHATAGFTLFYNCQWEQALKYFDMSDIDDPRDIICLFPELTQFNEGVNMCRYDIPSCCKIESIVDINSEEYLNALYYFGKCLWEKRTCKCFTDIAKQSSVDTALVQICVKLMLKKLPTPFAIEKLFDCSEKKINYCQPIETERILKSAGQYFNLVLFYLSKEKTKNSFRTDDDLKSLCRIAKRYSDNGNLSNGINSVILKLSSFFSENIYDTTNTHHILWKYAKLMLLEFPSKSMKIFTQEKSDYEFVYNPVLQYLKENVISQIDNYSNITHFDYIQHYLEFIVIQNGCSMNKYHDQLGYLYMQKIQQLTQNKTITKFKSLLTKTRDKFTEFLDFSKRYSPEVLLSYAKDFQMCDAAIIMLSSMLNSEHLWTYSSWAAKQLPLQSMNIFTHESRIKGNLLHIKYDTVIKHLKENVIPRIPNYSSVSHFDYIEYYLEFIVNKTQMNKYHEHLCSLYMRKMQQLIDFNASKTKKSLLNDHDIKDKLLNMLQTSRCYSPQILLSNARKLKIYDEIIKLKPELQDSERCYNCKDLTKIDAEECQKCQALRCAACNFFTSTDNNDKCRKCHTPNIMIPITVTNPFHESFAVKSAIIPSVSIENIFSKIIKYINKKYYPQKYFISKINCNSFLYTKNDINISIGDRDWNNISIRSFSRKSIAEQGLSIEINIAKYKHKVTNNDITCKYITMHQKNISSNDNDEKKIVDHLQCPIYKAMKIDYDFSEDNLNHLHEFSHFRDEYVDKVRCRHGQTCRAFIRLRDGGNRLDDRCHVKLYNHPPRTRRQLELSENMNSLIVNTEYKQNYGLYKPTDEDILKYNYNEKDGFINALIEEVTTNGFKNDLCLECTKNCTHSEFSLLLIVAEKLQHIRHKQMGTPLNRSQMLALVLYTGCDCNYDVCKSQRNGNYTKWKWFDYCLHHAILFLSQNENGTYKLYSGLNKVKLTKKDISLGYFPTYTSTSWIKEVATNFMYDEGMLIQIDKEMRNFFVCCDVSWISKFPDECEILISRSIGDGWRNNSFSLSVLDEQAGVQRVVLEQNQEDDMLLTELNK